MFFLVMNQIFGNTTSLELFLTERVIFVLVQFSYLFLKKPGNKFQKNLNSKQYTVNMNKSLVFIEDLVNHPIKANH